MSEPITSLADARHPIWKMLRSLLVGGLSLFALWLFYDRLDQRDITTVLTLMGGVLGFDVVKGRLTKYADESPAGDSGQ